MDSWRDREAARGYLRTHRGLGGGGGKWCGAGGLLDMKCCVVREQEEQNDKLEEVSAGEEEDRISGKSEMVRLQTRKERQGFEDT